jgi:hypothetical protein
MIPRVDAQYYRRDWRELQKPLARLTFVIGVAFMPLAAKPIERS